jgi:predicted SprT family Zn-dependent metalloprotease
VDKDIKAHFSLVDRYLQYNDEHFNGELPEGVPVMWNTRLRTTAGRCWYKRREDNSRLIDVRKIDLNSRLLDTEEKLKRTLVHEMVHGWLAHKRGVRDGHNWRFQEKMESIFGYRESHRFHTYDTSEVREQRKIEYHCPVHGVIGHRARMPRERDLGRYSCNDCGNKVTFVDRRESKTKTGMVGGFNPFA